MLNDKKWKSSKSTNLNQTYLLLKKNKKSQHTNAYLLNLRTFFIWIVSGDWSIWILLCVFRVHSNQYPSGVNPLFAKLNTVNREPNGDHSFAYDLLLLAPKLKVSGTIQHVCQLFDDRLSCGHSVLSLLWRKFQTMVRVVASGTFSRLA